MLLTWQWVLFFLGVLHVASLQEGERGSFVIVICNPFCVEAEDTLFEGG